MPVLTGRVDIANARLRFANGCIANLTASRISRDRVRKIRFFQPVGVSVDRLRRAEGGDVASWCTGGGVPVDSRRRVPVANEEPLVRELADFVDAVASGARRSSTGEQGRRALARGPGNCR